ncbi:sec-independent protein translocase protein TatA [Clavibacter michiganensis]|uniref:twin-arginine translocase TatA/TatE family subunit n=1 Tax=Clavibacter michiganensis TaxID=28447 RepID=UPI001D450FB9|nr:twin-arginine translocase TatA/TatE family subunit [Clavibacter michiganensis]MBP2457430.1 sec-independent protein translocase protein TatA [Clavibacter michiganensis]MDQ0410000.1 sec-independent protein translocase protein TatA [Clavibacter michiganensis]
MGLLQNLSGWHAVVILAVVLLLFGADRLPALARGAGESIRAFRTEVRDDDADPPAEASNASASAPRRGTRAPG